jgi:hypothetical protein
VPALPPALQVLRIQMKWKLGSAHGGGSRFYMLYSGGPPTATNCNTIASDVSGAFNTALGGAMIDTNELVEVVVTDLTSGSAAEGSWTGSIAGQLTGTPLPIDTCVLMNSHIPRRYRGGKPKIFLPFGQVSDLDSTDDQWNSTFIGVMNAAWPAFIGVLQGLTGIGCTLVNHVNVSYYHGFASVQNPVTLRWRNIPTPRSGDAVIDQISSTTINPYVSQQRRRRFEPVP